MAVVFVSLAVIGRHVPKSAALTPAHAGAAPQH